MQLKYALKDLAHYCKANAIIMINMVLLVYITIIVSLPVSGIFTGYKEVLNNETYEHQFLIVRTSEANNFNYNTLYNEGNRSTYKAFFAWLDNHFEIIGVAPNISIENSMTKIPNSNEFYVNHYFRKHILAPNLLEEMKPYAIKESVIPIILGNHYSNAYQIGDILNEEYSVTGILKENSFYYDFRAGYGPIYLDDKVFIPILEDNVDAIHYSILFERLLINNANIKDLESINTKAIELNLDPFNFRTQRAQFYGCVESDLEYLKLNMFFNLSVLIVSAMGSLFLVRYKVRDNLPNYRSHFVSGADKAAIYRRIIYENSMLVGISMLLGTSLIHGVLEIDIKTILSSSGIVTLIFIILLNSSSIYYVNKKINE